MGGWQNYGPFLGTLNIRCRIIIETQKGTIILTSTPCIEGVPERPLKGYEKKGERGVRVRGWGLRASGFGRRADKNESPFGSSIF